MKKIMNLVLLFVCFLAVSLSSSVPAHATAAYDSIVTAADVTGLGTTQVSLLVGMIGFTVVSVAYAIITRSLKKGKSA